MTQKINTESPVHDLFGLSYAKWLVLPRVIMEQMPVDWQRKIVELLEELDETYDWLPEDASIFVTMRDKKGKIVKLPEHLCNYRHPDFQAIDALKVNKSRS
jgi:hypothetical protein